MNYKIALSIGAGLILLPKLFNRKVRNINNAGINLIKSLEGLKLTSYSDGQYYSIGYGHNGPGVYPGQTITEQTANIYLRSDINSFVNNLNTVLDQYNVNINQNQYNALVSFIYNIGFSAFKDSTMYYYLITKQFNLIPNEFTKWVYDNGQYVQGLYNRRLKEKNTFIS